MKIRTLFGFVAGASGPEDPMMRSVIQDNHSEVTLTSLRWNSLVAR